MSTNNFCCFYIVFNVQHCVEMVKTLGCVRPMHSNPLHALHLLTVYTVNQSTNVH